MMVSAISLIWVQNLNPSVDSIIRTLNELGPGDSIFKVDISRAFRHIPNDPGDIDLLGLRHRDHLYLDLKTPFGYHLGSIFSRKSAAQFALV